MHNRRLKALLTIFSVLNAILLIFFLFLQIIMAPLASKVGWIDSNLSALETKYLLMESDITLFKGISSVWVLKEQRDYVETPEQVIYVNFEHEKVQASNIN